MSTDILIAGRFVIAQGEIGLTFIRSAGPGGQNVNKVATAAQLRFDLAANRTLPVAVRDRAARLAGTRLSNDGVIVLTASRFRTQAQNRDDAIARLVHLLETASIAPKRRIATRPTLASRHRREKAKKLRADTKSMRGRVDPDRH